MKPYTEKDVPDQAGRTVLVTGANTGIGLEAARVFAERGARVLLGCRSQERAQGARRQVLAAAPRAEVVWLPLDLGDLSSVRQAADQVSSEAQLDLLINNAGIMIPPRTETVDGFESQFGVNHLGHFALTGLLLPKLTETAGSRVVTVSSSAHRAGRIDFKDPHAERRYDRIGRYGMSKLANLLFTYELARRIEGRGHGPTATACHPGVSETELARNGPSWMFLVTLVARPFSHLPPSAALPTLRAATDPQARAADYFGPKGPFGMSGPPAQVKSSAASHDRESAARLWALSIDLTGIDPGL